MSQTTDTLDKSYWRSLERLLESPAVQEQLAEEFASGASLPPDGVGRRTMLKLMGASFAMAGLASCRRPEEAIVPFVSPPESLIPGIPKYYATTMPFGTGAYGLLVESHESRPTKIEGNELHPASRGAASAWMQASVLSLYDPDRSKKVLKKNPENSEFQETDWNDFLNTWIDLRIDVFDTEGADMAILTEAYSSPTLNIMRSLIQDRFPRARWVVFEPVGEENVFEGTARLAGSPLRPLYHFDKARTIIAFDSDFLFAENESLVSARRFMARRKITGPQDSMNRLYCLENTLSVTGSNADHRLALPARRIPAALLYLARALNRLGLPVEIPSGLSDSNVSGEPAKKLDLMAADLLQAGSEGLVLAGRRQPAVVHALTLALNQALGSLGNTVTLHPLKDTGYSRSDDLKRLVSAMHEGEINVLLQLGGNPVYTAPADLKYGAALQNVRHSIHLSEHFDETSRLSEWHLPQSHFLESWGDARSADGTASVIQPLIAPLFDTRSAFETVAYFLWDDHQKGYDLIRSGWQNELLPGEDFESAWRRVLHDGILKDSEIEPVPVTVNSETLAEVLLRSEDFEVAAEDSLEISFHPSATTWDGRFSNNGWLQEMPDPITRIAWDNAALVSPETARRLGIESGQLIRLQNGEDVVEAPAWILPGQANDSISIALGYGREAAGRVGTGVGVNAYAIRHSNAPFFESGIRVEPTGKTHLLAQTQEHWSMEGRSLVRWASLEEYRSNPDFASEPEAELEPVHLWPEVNYTEGLQWGMSIDLNSCTGCNACVIACQSENNIPIVGKTQVARGREMQWLRVDRYFTGGVEDPKVVFQPVPCMHCENAPCEQVCPVAATVHDREGLNLMVYNRCIGTRYCSNNCPYKVRRFNFFNYTKDVGELSKMGQNPDVTVRSRGVMEKCTYCIQRINEAKRTAKREEREVRDGEILTACQQTCPTEAIVFGNLNDPQSRVSQLKKQNRQYLLLASLQNKPRTSYLARLTNPNADWERLGKGI